LLDETHQFFGIVSQLAVVFIWIVKTGHASLQFLQKRECFFIAVQLVENLG
jgi:hypothetical protein